MFENEIIEAHEFAADCAEELDEEALFTEDEVLGALEELDALERYSFR